MKGENRKLILVVDDDYKLLHLIRDALEFYGFSVVIATTGPRALDKLKEFTPDLFILDIKMEPMNGFDLCHEIRKMYAFKNTPVFFFTGVNEALAQKFSKTIGVQSYVSKPVEIDDLVARIKAALSIP